MLGWHFCLSQHRYRHTNRLPGPIQTTLSPLQGTFEAPHGLRDGDPRFPGGAIRRGLTIPGPPPRPSPSRPPGGDTLTSSYRSPRWTQLPPPPSPAGGGAPPAPIAPVRRVCRRVPPPPLHHQTSPVEPGAGAGGGGDDTHGHAGARCRGSLGAPNYSEITSTPPPTGHRQCPVPPVPPVPPPPGPTGPTPPGPTGNPRSPREPRNRSLGYGMLRPVPVPLPPPGHRYSHEDVVDESPPAGPFQHVIKPVLQAATVTT